MAIKNVEDEWLKSMSSIGELIDLRYRHKSQILVPIWRFSGSASLTVSFKVAPDRTLLRLYKNFRTLSRNFGVCSIREGDSQAEHYHAFYSCLVFVSCGTFVPQ